MKRRSAIQSLGMLSTHVLFPSILTGFIAGCKNSKEVQEPYTPKFFTQEEFVILQEIIDTIIPSSTTLSASETNVHNFLDEVFLKCLSFEAKEFLQEGIKRLIPSFKSATDKTEFLTDVDRKAYAGNGEDVYFRTIKQYTLVGFFTSQEGITKGSNYVKFPGDYKGEIKMDRNTLNYGKTNLRYYL